MRKNIKFSIIIAIASLIISSIAACTKDRKLDTFNLYGMWKEPAAGGIHQYQFRSDSTFIFSDLAIAPGTTKILGYHYKSTGRYRLNNSELILYDLKLFVNPKGDYGSEKELFKTTVSAQSMIYTIKMEEKKLSLYFDCPLNASCPSSPYIFVRQ